MNHRSITLAAAILAAGIIGFGSPLVAHSTDHGMHEHHHGMNHFIRHDRDNFHRHHRDSGYDSHYSPWCMPRLYVAPYGGRHYYCEPSVYLF